MGGNTKCMQLPPWYAHGDGREKERSDCAVRAGPAGDSMTVQAHAEDADINVLMRRFGITGQFPENPRVPVYGDFSSITDYRSAVEAVRQAEIGFMEFPAELRARFENDPQKLLDFCANGANLDEARKLGLIKESSDVSGGKPVQQTGKDAGVAPSAAASGSGG